MYIPDTSKSNYGTVTFRVRRYRNCSRTYYIDLHRGRHKIYTQELLSIPKEFSYKRQCRTSSEFYCKDLWGRSQQDLQKIFSQEPVRDHVRTPGKFQQNPFKSFSQGPVQDHAKASDSMHKELSKTFTKLFMPDP